MMNSALSDAITLAAILLYIVEAIVFVGVVLLVLVGIQRGLTYLKSQQDLKARKTLDEIVVEQHKYHDTQEAAAHEGFFEESYVPGVNANGETVYYVALAHTPEAKEFYSSMDRLVDDIIFYNTEEL